jgi:two-component system chemotaxis response regulator CheB
VTAAALKPSTERRVRVLIADHSAIVRGFMRRWIEDDQRIELVKACGESGEAIVETGRLHPDVIVLDADMPGMDGLSTLPHLRKAAPHARIVIASVLSPVGAAAAMKALGAGACDFIAKPEASAVGSVETYRRELIEKIIALGEHHPLRPQSGISLRRKPQTCCPGSLLVIAAATGGPAALQTFLTPIARRIEAPILIVQHMPAKFTPAFAEKLEQATGKHCREARDGDTLAPGAMLLAPGDHHLRVARCPAGRMVHIDKGAPVHFCRPAADPLFESAAAAFGPRVVGVVLTGIGRDGCEGSARIVAAGGRVIVQDEATSVVWGMPGAVAMAGHAEAVKPLRDLSSLALKMMNGDGA